MFKEEILLNPSPRIPSILPTRKAAPFNLVISAKS